MINNKESVLISNIFQRRHLIAGMCNIASVIAHRTGISGITPTEIFFQIYDTVSSYVSLRLESCVLVYKCLTERNAFLRPRDGPPREMSTVKQDADNLSVYRSSPKKKRDELPANANGISDGGHFLKWF